MGSRRRLKSLDLDTIEMKACYSKKMSAQQWKNAIVVQSEAARRVADERAQGARLIGLLAAACWCVLAGGVNSLFAGPCNLTLLFSVFAMVLMGMVLDRVTYRGGWYYARSRSVAPDTPIAPGGPYALGAMGNFVVPAGAVFRWAGAKICEKGGRFPVTVTRGEAVVQADGGVTMVQKAQMGVKISAKDGEWWVDAEGWDDE